MHWSYFEEGRGSTIFADDGQRIDLRPPAREQFRFPNVQRFRDGRWLVTEARTDLTTPNAHVFKSDGTIINSFYAGDGIQTVLLDQRGGIWIGYFDEGVFGAFNPMPPQGHPSYDYGPSGLVRLDDRGKIEFAYNRQFPDKLISDIEALTLDDEGSAWFCPYTDYFVASVVGDHVDYVLPRAPTAGADALSIGAHHFAFFGGFHRSSMVAVVNRQTERMRLIQLRGSDLGSLSPIRVATRGTKAIAIANGELYKLDQETLLDALGPWTDDNTCTLASAVQYLDEESSYSGTYLIYPNGPKLIPGQPRPPENPPRSDEDKSP